METTQNKIQIVSITEEKVFHRGEFGDRYNPTGTSSRNETVLFANLSNGGKISVASLKNAMWNSGAIKTMQESKYFFNAKRERLVQFINERINEETYKALGI